MHELYELKEKLCDELTKYGKKDITASTLEYVDKLAHAAKNVAKLLEEDEEYSGRGGYSNRGSYARGGNMMYDGNMSYEGGGGSFARGDGRGRGINARRDSMGRYSSADSMVSELRELKERAPDERTRMEFDRFIQRMESM